jgi:hypothetical protein
MSENDFETGEEQIDDSGRNPTQQRMDEEGESSSDAPADVGGWTDTVDQPHEGEEGQDVA